ncbi:uncharacterized protein [Sinocyclocheilus grahami]|uniref:uncharacterized protein n=1 Tax=Sinocyclocheilus grahami TaxID=75366 RepID=UPI0007AD0532|nr:PREDICTED: uncharacterized protein LOC107556340 [Sinocyclocheilus grahami]
MTAKLRKFKYDGTGNSRPSDSTGKGSVNQSSQTLFSRQGEHSETDMDIDVLKSEILTSIRAEIGLIMRSEIKAVLAEDFDYLKNELQKMRSEIANNALAMRTKLDRVNVTIKDVEEGLSAWSDETTTLQTKVTKLESQVKFLEESCENTEGRMRRNKVRIVGVAETPGSSNMAAVCKLLQEALNIERELQIDRSHRSLTPKRPGGNPRAIIVRMHYYQDREEILKKTREMVPLKFNGHPIAIFPDFTAKVAKAKAAFTEVKKHINNRPDIRYGFIYPAKLRITFSGDQREFIDPEKAMAFVMNTITTSS